MTEYSRGISTLPNAISMRAIHGASLTGLLILGMLLSTYLTALSVTDSGGGFCELLEGDCLAAVRSPLGHVWGFSAASLGLGYYAFQLSLAAGMAGRWKESAGGLRRTQQVAALLAVSASLYFLYLLRTVMVQGCPACYGAHLVNGCVLLLSFIGGPAGQGTPPASNDSRKSGLGLTFQALKIPLLIALTVFLTANLLESRFLLARERMKLEADLDYYRYRHQAAPAHEIALSPGDTVIGEPAIAVHQVVLIYKRGCRHCQEAREFLAELAREHQKAVYLVLKDVSSLPESTLKRLQVERVPSVFVDGRQAEGWAIPGFMEFFAKDCGC